MAAIACVHESHSTTREEIRISELTRENEDLRRQVADRRQLEYRLLQAQADLARINRVTTMGELSALAHEIKQPITAVIMNANTCLRWLAADKPNLDEARAAATRIVGDGARTAEIIKRTRVLFQGGMPEKELVDVSDVVRDVVFLLRGEAARYGISLRTDVAPGLPFVAADRIQLEQVVMNLVANAIDAVKVVDDTRKIVIESRPDEDQLVVAVRDTGVGLSGVNASRIFDVFFTTKDHGTGLGLAISRFIVEAHGGQLQAAENLPRGATFSFALPLASEANPFASARK